MPRRAWRRRTCWRRLTLYHIAQKACNNALKHANVEVRLRGARDVAVLEIQDDGTGVVVPTTGPGRQEGLGLRIMRNRAEIIGAELAIEAAPPHGTLVRCILKPERRHGPKKIRRKSPERTKGRRYEGVAMSCRPDDAESAVRPTGTNEVAENGRKCQVFGARQTDLRAPVAENGRDGGVERLR